MSPVLRRSMFHRLFTDGSSRGNPGPAGVGAALHTPDRRIEATLSAALPHAVTSNVAEYHACLHGLQLARALGVRNLLVLSDSRLLVAQVRGTYATRHPALATLRAAVVAEAAAGFDRCVFAHVSRVHNTAADRLAFRASGAAAAVEAAASSSSAQSDRNTFATAISSTTAATTSLSSTTNMSHIDNHSCTDHTNNSSGIASDPMFTSPSSHILTHAQVYYPDSSPAFSVPREQKLTSDQLSPPQPALHSTSNLSRADSTNGNPPVTVAASEPVLRASAWELIRAWAPRPVHLEAA